MVSRAALAAVMLIYCLPNATAQQAAAPPEPYDDDDAYQIYNLVLPQAEAFGCGTVIVREETAPELHESLPWPTGPEGCMSPAATTRFKDAIADYNLLNHKRWLLRRKFQFGKPYKIVSWDTLKIVLDGDGWDGFHKRYPTSGGYLIMSAVGFNRDKTRAIVYSGGSWGSLCGDWSFHLLEKVDGKWKPAPGVTCDTVS